jgi:hypothetical protein
MSPLLADFVAKVVSTVIKIFSRPLMRFSDKYVRDLVSQ